MVETEQEHLASSWRFFSRPHEAWEAMYEDCNKALESIEFEQYILENDSVGQRFMEMFIAKAKKGLRVFLICDSFGSSLLRHSPLIKELRRHGGRVHFYNAISRWMVFTPWLWFPRTHTKTLLIDSTIGYTGGVCMAQRMSHWRDTHIRVTGPVVEQIRHAFDDIENKILRKKRKRIAVPPNISGFNYCVSGPSWRRRDIYKQIIKNVSSAERYIYIASAFFIPNRRFLKLLKAAHERGAEIKILVPERSDVLLADWLRLSYTRRFLDAGIQILHYQQTVLHSKMAIVDDTWATVGSTNFDVISFFHNREANIVITEAEAIAELKQRFLADLEGSSELTRDVWKTIPLWKKVAGYAARSLRVFFR